MNAKLIDQVEYLDGYIQNRQGLDEEINVDKFSVVESNLRGWGSANAVVLVDGSHYLAVVSECPRSAKWNE
jgi:hypothetical protein